MPRASLRIVFALGLLLATMGTATSPSAAADGDLRTSFSGNGRVITDLDAGSDDLPEAAAVDDVGRLVVVGRSIKAPMGVRLAVARYLPNGELDPSSGTGGLVVSDAEGGLAPSDVLLDGAGRIVVAGRAVGAAGAGSSKVARLLPDGRFDASLGGTGAIALDLARGGPDEARDVLVDGFGRIVLAGSAQPETGRFALARLHEDGRLDRSLRGSGVALIRMSQSGDQARAMVPHGRGNVILSGYAPPHVAFVKVRGAGGLDKRFGQGGRAKLVGGPDRSFSEDSRAVAGFGHRTATAAALAVFPNRDVAVVGPARRFAHHEFAVARYEG